MMPKPVSLLAAALLCLLVPVLAVAEYFIYINEDNFPDANFRRFVSDAYGQNAYGQNNILIETKINNITEINVNKMGIKSLKGIEYFTALKYLGCSGNQLTTLDVSQNTALLTLACSGNQLTTLDVSQNTELEKLNCFGNQLTALDIHANNSLNELRCDNNQLTALDVSGNPQLIELDCSDNQLTSLDVSKNTELEKLDCIGNQLTALYIHENTSLNELRCANNQLTTLDVSNKPSLESLNCSNNHLTTLNVSNSLPSTLDCTNNHLTSLDFGSQQTYIMDFTLNVGENRYLVTVGPDRTFDLRKLPGSFNVDKASGWNGGTVSNGILTVEAGAEKVTYKYMCKDGGENYEPIQRTFTLLIDTRPDGEVTDAAPAAPVTVLTLVLPAGQTPAFKTMLKYELRTDAAPNTVAYDVDYIDLGGNKLPLPGESTLCFPYPEGLDETSLSAYRIVIRHEMDGGKTETFSSEDGEVQLTKQGICIPVSSLSPFAITWVNLAETDVAINAANFPDEAFRSYVFKEFDRDKNHYLSDTEIDRAIAINVPSKGIKSLKGIEYLTACTELNCAVNQLTALDVSANRGLTELYCNNNQLTTLDVSRNPALANLSCSSNQLTSLDVSGNPRLIDLNCSGNQLTSLDVSGSPQLIELNCSGNQLTSLDLSRHANLINAKLDANRYTVVVGSDRTFDLSKLPGAFDVKRAGGWKGGSVSGSMLRIGRDARQVTYTYDCGRGKSETFTLLVVELPQTGDAESPGLWLALLALSASALALLLRRRAA